MQSDQAFVKLAEGPTGHIQLGFSDCNYVQKHRSNNSQLLNNGVSPQEVP